MPKRTLDITTREQLNIYMNPQRQLLLHEMQVLARPATCKQLADIMGISSSSVTHHMKKLEALGLVEIARTEVVRGINARYWRAVPAEVNLRVSDRGDLQEEKALLADYVNRQAYDGMRTYAMSGAAERDREKGLVPGEQRSGIMHLTEKDARTLQQYLTAFIAAHEEPGEGTCPWEFSVMCYPHRDRGE